ncbi:hypothetical protein LMH68_023225 (plasmid) [Vibrio sp. F13]|uniref:hypothetical protein n=1 Tax=Vibrio sp. F13 TaxID=2070777 RepID=UPI0039B4758C
MKRVIFDNHPLLSQEELEMLAMVVGGRGEEGGASRLGRIKNDRDLESSWKQVEFAASLGINFIG